MTGAAVTAGFAERYRSGLDTYLDSGDRDAALSGAFALGREAVDSGRGLLELCGIHGSAQESSLTATEARQLGVASRRASEFLAESLAPFEMVHRGFRETNAAVQRLNQQLQQTVDELRQLAAIVEAADDAIYMIDLEGDIRSWNPAAERLYGYSAAEAVGASADMLVPPERETERGLVLRLQRRESTTQFETMRVRKDGGTVDVSVTASPIAGGGGVVAMAVIARDIGQRRRAEEAHTKLEEQLRQAQKMEAVGNLAGGVAHDFNNLLTVISGYGSILLARLGEGESSHEVLKIAGAADRAAELTKQLLAFSRQQVMEPEQVILDEVVGETLSLLDRLIGEDIEVEHQFAADLQPIMIDRGQLGQVMLNLAINARDAMPDGGRLTVKTANVDLDEAYTADPAGVIAGPHVLLQVTDSGVGMDEQTRSRVFDPFFTTKDEGTGLGLATVYGIVKQSGGHLWVYSEPGCGTTFKIHFPVTPDGTTSRRRAAPPKVVSLEGTETILVVEDDDGVRGLVTFTLRSFGYTVLEAESPAAALRLASVPSAFDLLLTDVVMPGMNGRELAERLVAERPRLRVLFSSGYPADTIVRHGIADASAAYIEKPYLPTELARKLRELLDAPLLAPRP